MGAVCGLEYEQSKIEKNSWLRVSTNQQNMSMREGLLANRDMHGNTMTAEKYRNDSRKDNKHNIISLTRKNADIGASSVVLTKNNASNNNYSTIMFYLDAKHGIVTKDKKMIFNLSVMDDIEALKDDWNGYGAKMFTSDLINMCTSLIESLEFQPEIYPTGRSSIQFQYELDDRSYLEFEIFETKIDCLMVPRRNYYNAENYSLSTSSIDKIKEIVQTFYEH